MRTTLHDTVNSRFYTPFEMALAAAKLSRNCPGFTDSAFLEAGVGRVIDEAITGGAWVQKLQQMVSMRLSKTIEDIRQRGLKPNPMVANLSRVTQRSLQFIRWLRCHIFGQTPYTEAVENLRPYMVAYIT